MGDTKIIMSEQTREAISPKVVDFLERRETPGVVVPEAIVSIYDFDSLSPSSDFPKDQEIVDRIITGISGTDEKFRQEVETILKSASTEDNNAFHINPIAVFRMRNNIPPGEQGMPEDYTIATVPNINSVSEFASAATSIPQGAFATVMDDVSLKDLRTYALFHEIGHGNHGTVSFAEEHDAENIGNNLYATAFKEGVVTDPRIPEIMSEIRAISTFHSVIGSEKYVLNGTLQPENSVSTIEPTGRITVNDTVSDAYTLIGAEVENSNHQTKALGIFSDNELQTFMTAEQITELRELRAAYDNPSVSRDDTINRMDGLMREVEIPENMRDEYQDELDFHLHKEGFELVNTIVVDYDEEGNEIKDFGQPEILYTTVRGQLIAGAYDEDPKAHALATNFVLGAERLAPDHYNVSDYGQTYEQYLEAQGTPDTFGYDSSTIQVPQSENITDPAVRIPMS